MGAHQANRSPLVSPQLYADSKFKSRFAEYHAPRNPRRVDGNGREDLLGPAGGPEEEFDQREDRVTGRYLVGMLAPKSTPVEADELDRLGTDGEDDPEVGTTDASTPPASTFFPNSIGTSFVVEIDANAIRIKTEWGRYRRVKSATQINRKTGRRRMYGSANRSRVIRW